MGWEGEEDEECGKVTKFLDSYSWKALRNSLSLRSGDKSALQSMAPVRLRKEPLSTEREHNAPLLYNHRRAIFTSQAPSYRSIL